MRLMEARGLSKDWDGTPLFEAASVSIDEAGKIGIVGSNGSGRPGLLGIFAGRDQDFRGSLKR